VKGALLAAGVEGAMEAGLQKIWCGGERMWSCDLRVACGCLRCIGDQAGLSISAERI